MSNACCSRGSTSSGMSGKTCSAQFKAQRISDLCCACDSAPPRCSATNRLSRILRTVAVLAVVFHASTYMYADAAAPAKDDTDSRPPRHFPAVFSTLRHVGLLARHRATDYRGISCVIIAVSIVMSGVTRWQPTPCRAPAGVCRLPTEQTICSTCHHRWCRRNAPHP